MLCRVRPIATPWLVACQAPLSVGFSRQGSWSGLPCPLPPGDLPNPGIKPRSHISCCLRWQAGSSALPVKLLSRVRLFAAPRTAARQASLSFTLSRSVLKYHLTSSTSVVPLSFCLRSFPASGSFPSSRLYASGGQSVVASASSAVLPRNVQGRFPLELTGLISLQSKGLLCILYRLQ